MRTAHSSQHQQRTPAPSPHPRPDHRAGADERADGGEQRRRTPVVGQLQRMRQSVPLSASRAPVCLCARGGGPGGSPPLLWGSRKAASSGASLARPRAQRLFTVPGRTAQDGRRFLDRVAVHVDEHQRRPLIRVQPAPAPRQTWSRCSWASTGRLGGAPSSAARSRSSGSGSAARTLRLRSRSRQALTTTRCSQVVTAGLAAVGRGAAKGGDVGVLQRVGRVLGIAHHPQRDRPEPVLVPGDQDGERVRGRRRHGPAAARRRPACPTGQGESSRLQVRKRRSVDEGGTGGRVGVGVCALLTCPPR